MSKLSWQGAGKILLNRDYTVGNLWLNGQIFWFSQIRSRCASTIMFMGMIITTVWMGELFNPKDFQDSTLCEQVY